MKTFYRISLIFIAFAMVLSACGGASPTPNAGQPETVQPQVTQAPEVQAPATEAASAVQPPAEKILKVGWSSEPDTMNPLTTYSTEAQEIIALIYDKLISYDLNFKPEPALATDYSYSEDGLTVTFNLRPDVKWHDGEPFTAEDVAFTYNLIKDNEIGEYSQWLVHMVSATAADDYTFVLTFDIPQAFNPALAIPILPKHIWSSMGASDIETFANDQPVGTGPYKFVEWQVGSLLTLSRNDEFWGDAPAPAKIVYVLYGNEDVMAQALKSGDIDIITEVPPTIWDGLTNVDNIKAVSLPSFSFHHIGFNVLDSPDSPGNPLLLDKTIRQALNYALDRNQLVQVALAGHGRPGDSILPIGLTDWYLNVQSPDATPEKAKEMLDQAGYTDTNGDGVREDANGTPLEFRLIAIETTSVDVRAAQLFRDAAAAIGIKLDLQTMDENTLGELVYNVDNPDWDIFVWGWDSSVPDPNYMLGVPLCSQIGGNNDVFYCNKAYDDLYEKQAATLDYATRKPMVDEMQQMFYDDAAYIVMWYQDKLQAYRTDTWTGWTEIPGGLIYNMTRDNYLNITPVQ
jgi:peptide/nickel transport system substrate-binding protein